MKKLSTGHFSDGKEEFFIQKILNGIVHLFTKTGVKFLRAKENSTIEVGEKDLNSFLERELKGFSKIENNN